MGKNAEDVRASAVRAGAAGGTLVGIDVPPTGMLGSATGAFAGFAKTALCSKAADETAASLNR